MSLSSEKQSRFVDEPIRQQSDTDVQQWKRGKVWFVYNTWYKNETINEGQSASAIMYTPGGRNVQILATFYVFRQLFSFFRDRGKALNFLKFKNLIDF